MPNRGAFTEDDFESMLDDINAAVAERMYPPVVIPGFVPKPRTIEITCPFIEPVDGAEPMRATIATNLTFEQIDGLRALVRDSSTTFAAMFEAICPYVVAWNAVAYDNVSGTYHPVPSPAEIGVDAFRVLDPMVTSWLAVELSNVHMGGADRQGKSKPSDVTPAPDGDGITTSRMPTPMVKTRSRNRKGSPAFSATT